MRAPRRGGLLIEALVALTLGAIVLAVFVGVLAASLRWTAALVGRGEALEVVRTVWAVLDEDLRAGFPGRDWLVVGPDVVSLRAYRGVARVCPGGAGPESWTVAYRGRRLPDPTRDSVLVLGVDGGWRAFALDRSDVGGGCDLEAGEAAFRWSWQQSEAPPPALVRLFERGEYHLAEGAFRYRRGAGGRQPLTVERLGPGSGFNPVAAGLEVRVDFRGDRRAGDLEPFVWRVHGGGDGW
jgi:hypothetical protein